MIRFCIFVIVSRDICWASGLENFGLKLVRNKLRQKLVRCVAKTPTKISVELLKVIFADYFTLTGATLPMFVVSPRKIRTGTRCQEVWGRAAPEAFHVQRYSPRVYLIYDREVYTATSVISRKNKGQRWNYTVLNSAVC